MAYINDTEKKSLDLKVKEVAKKYNVKLTTKRVRYSIYSITIRSGAIDFVNDLITNQPTDRGQKRVMQIEKNIQNDCFKMQFLSLSTIEDYFEGKSKKFLMEVYNIIYGEKNGYHDNSDSQRDYFDISWYNEIKIGADNKPYEYQK